MTAGGGKMGTAVVSGPKAQKAVPCGPKAQKWSTAAGDLFNGLQSNLIDHMVSRQQKKIPMVPKMQKKCAWAEMYQNDGLPWIYPLKAQKAIQADWSPWSHRPQ